MTYYSKMLLLFILMVFNASFAADEPIQQEDSVGSDDHSNATAVITNWSKQNIPYKSLTDAINELQLRLNELRADWLPFTWVLDGNVVYAEGCDLGGQDILKIADTKKEDCGNMCLSNPLCDHFNWDTKEICWQKKWSGIAPTARGSARCGFIPSRTSADPNALKATVNGLIAFNSQKQSKPNDIEVCDVFKSAPQTEQYCQSACPKYRTFDGSCFNLKNTQMGKAGTTFGRIYPANYADGMSAFRQSVSGSELPSARLISSQMSDLRDLQPLNSLIVMQWGQFLFHDLASTQEIAFDGLCCSNGGHGTRIGIHPINQGAGCMSIQVPENDPIYSEAGIRCMTFIRSASTNSGTRQSINKITHWLDGSVIYGSSLSAADQLRDKGNQGRLHATTNKFGRLLLPFITNSIGLISYSAGDAEDRVNVHPLIVTMHTIWFREHNRVAHQLAQLMPGRDDEFLFQEARRIVIAEMQHITYTEYLPIIIGRKLADQVMGNRNSLTDDLSSTDGGPVFTEFSTAASRLGHSQIAANITLYEANGTVSSQSFSLVEGFLGQLNDRFFTKTFLDNVLRGLTQEPLKQVGPSFANAIHSQLFGVGLDLISTNIQRGRDHGLPTYAAVTGYKTFDCLSATTSQENINLLKRMYDSVQDIDLYIGGISETPLPGASVGPTFASIVAKQFRTLRVTDRFFYDDLSQSVSFTSKQLTEIQKVSLARIICDNNDGSLTSIQPNAFISPIGFNAPRSCKSIPGINFSIWI